MRVAAVLLLVLILPATSACFWGLDDGWASRREIIEAAERCGVADFKPTKAGAGWAAYVDRSVPDHAAKEDCIYDDLHAQGLLVTR